MKKEELIKYLEKMSFSKLEAQIYLVLLEGGEMSAYQIAKKIEISRPSIYNALEHMYEKGIIETIPESTTLYVAQTPDTLINRMQYDFEENRKKLSSGLFDFMKTRREERYLNFKGFETVMFEAKKILKETKKEIYINADFDLHIFEEEFKELKRRGIKVIVFSFPLLPIENLPVDYYTHKAPLLKDKSPSRLMLVADESEVLLADFYKSRAEWTGVVTNNPLMVAIASEHIHNDIYMLQFSYKYGSDLFEKGIGVESAFEERFMECKRKENEQ